MKNLLSFIKNEAVLCAAFAAALLSCMFVPVTNFADYIDSDTISMLFSLMAIVAGLSDNGVFTKLSQMLTKKAGTTRSAALILLLITYFMSMLITNDVALITFVPLTISIFGSRPAQLIYVTVLQTIAANMGSMLTPVGNPQNLYLYTYYKMTIKEFMSVTFPVCVIGLAAVLVLTIFVKNEKLAENDTEPAEITNPSYIIVYLMLFVLAVLAVLKIISTVALFASVCAVVVIMEPKIFREVDYSLLFTFAFFFIFVGNVKNIPAVCGFMESIVSGREFEVSIALSQIISNVPAAVMMSAFTEKGSTVLLGADIGGLGTLIASLASLISYRIYTSSENADGKKYIGTFTAVNLILLAVMYVFAKLWLLPAAAA